MKYLILIISLLIVSCQPEEPTASPPKQAVSKDCEIRKYVDQIIEGRDKITGLKFLCNSAKDSTIYLFRDNNPFVQLGLNKTSIDHPRYDNKKDAHLFFQKGNADFDLKGETFESLNKKLGGELPSGLSGIGLSRASSLVTSQYDKDFATILYHLTLSLIHI